MAWTSFYFLKIALEIIQKGYREIDLWEISFELVKTSMEVTFEFATWKGLAQWVPEEWLR